MKNRPKAGRIVLVRSGGQQRVTHQLHLDAQARSTAGTVGQAQRERLPWLSSHAGSQSPRLKTRKAPVIPRVSHAHTLEITRTEIERHMPHAHLGMKV